MANSKSKYIPFTESEIQKIIELFKSKVILDSKKEIIIVKFNSKGYKITHNNYDNFYYVSVITFKEPINIKKPVYFNEWNGSMLLKHRGLNIDNILDVINSNNLFLNIQSDLNCFYMSSYDKKNKIIKLSKNNHSLSFAEYNSFFNWYNNNYIWIITIKDDDNLNKPPSSPMNFLNNKLLQNRIKCSNYYIKIDGDNKAIDIKDKKYSACFI